MNAVKILISTIWLPFAAIVFLLSFHLKYDVVGIFFLLSCAQSVFFLVNIFSKKGFNGLVCVYFIFQLVFLSLAPWIHYSESLSIWRSDQISESSYVLANLLILLAGMIVYLSHLRRPNFKSQQSLPFTKLTNKQPKKYALLFLSASSFCLLFYLNDFSILQLLFRGILDETRSQVLEMSSLALLLGLTSRLIPVFCFLYAATEIQGARSVKIILFILMVISVFPTGVARYLVAFAYIPVILIYFPKMRNASVFSGVLLGSILFIFPFLDQFRYFSGFENFQLLPTVDFFYAAHFDAFENFASAIEGGFISYGFQLLGVIFFYIPRAFWPDKPVGSGYQMAENMGYSFNNISMPFLGEGFVNFGYFGVLVFALIIGVIIGNLDRLFSRFMLNGSEINFSSAVYFYLLGALFFVLRGDLLSSVAYVTAGLFSAFFVRFMCKKKRKLFR